MNEWMNDILVNTFITNKWTHNERLNEWTDEKPNKLTLEWMRKYV